MTQVKKRQIRTLSQLTDRQATEPHRVFMKVSTLEMEKNRRQQERQKAMQRIQKIDSRIQEINAEVAELLSVLNPPQTTSTASIQQSINPERPQPPGRKFVLKY